MKSIRLTLIVYFLLLLAGAWAAASWLIYDSAAQNLQAKQGVQRDLLRKEFDERVHQEKENLDDRLSAKASILAHYMQTQLQWEQTRLAQTVSLGLMNESQGHLFLPLWYIETWTWNMMRGPGTPASVSPFIPSVVRHLVTQINVKESDLPREPREGAGPSPAEYFQIDTDVGVSWPSLPADIPPLFKADTFDPNRLIESKFDDVHVATGKTVRRIQLKFSPTRQQFTLPRRRSQPAPQPSPDQARADRPPPSSPWFVIHVALEPVLRDARVANYRADFDKSLSAQDQAAAEELARLRQKLLLIGLGAFSATALGCYFVLGIGLAPLRRLSDAVSRVSPRDFKLPLADNATLGSELAPVADRLRETLDQLRRVFEREKQAAADISHELRTPVASLLATLDVALRKPRTADEYRQTLLDCRAVGGQMRQLVERIMALARIDAGSDHVRIAEIDVGELIGDVATMLNPLAAERGLKLRTQCAESQLCHTDPDKLREILVNLLHNAIQYNRPSGTIDVSADMANGWLNLRVRDSGVGIAAEAREHIFERFYRADPSRNGSGLHAGLGLSIVKGYVALLGGTVSVESELGKGSTFQVRVPTGEAAKSKLPRPTVAAAL
jgi:signal transduction histidine kinase